MPWYSTSSPVSLEVGAFQGLLHVAEVVHRKAEGMSAVADLGSSQARDVQLLLGNPVPTVAWSGSARASRSADGVRDADPPASPRPRSSSSTVMSATRRPRPITTTWSAISCISLIRWLETRTVRPSSAKPRRSDADPAHAVEVQAVDRLVEEQHIGIAQESSRDAEPLPHAEGVALDPTPGGLLRTDQPEHLVHAAGRDPVGKSRDLERERDRSGRGASRRRRAAL